MYNNRDIGRRLAQQAVVICCCTVCMTVIISAVINDLSQRQAT